MKSNYKKIGDFIRLVDIRNKDLSVSDLLGVSINKEFIPSVANIIGSDMTNYKIIKKGQFACSLMQVRRDKKIPVALLEKQDIALISQAYPVFEIKDTAKMLPEYLMMWMSRTEFDREACFLAVGGVRGSLEWVDFCNMELPVPSTEEQRAIVAEYNTVLKNIKNNEKIIETLESTANAIYKEWFVEFNFPDKNGNPYKSSGGAMTYNSAIEKEIPEGWSDDNLEHVAIIKAGGDRPRVFSNCNTKECSIPIYSNGIIKDGLYGYTDKHNYPEQSITISARGTIGFCVLRMSCFDAIVRLLVVIPNNKLFAIYLWQVLKRIDFEDNGSVQSQLTIPLISVLKILIPSNNVLVQYVAKTEIIYKAIEINRAKNNELESVCNLIFSKMSSLGGVKC